MKRRKFLIGSVGSILTGTPIHSDRPGLAVSFDVYQPRDINAEKVESAVVSIDNFSIQTQYMNDNEKIELTTKAITEDGRQDEKTASLGFNNGSPLTQEDIQDSSGQNLSRLHIEGIDTTNGSLQGEVIVHISHPSIRSRTFQRSFVISAAEAPPSGVSRWTFDDSETNNSTTTDVWNTNNGELFNVNTSKEGELNQSYEFKQNSGSYVNVPHANSLQLTSQLSFSLWVNVDSLPPDWAMLLGKVGKGTDSENRTYSVWLNKNGYFHLTSASDEQGQTRVNTQNGSVQTGSWIHYVGVIDRLNGFITSYINGGDEKASRSIDTNEAVTHTDPLRFGYDNYQNSNYYPLDGRLDNIRLYNKALSDDEVRSLYNNNTILQG